MQDLVDVVNADGDDRKLEPRGDHANAAAKGGHLSTFRAHTFGKDQYRETVTGHLGHLPQRLPCAGLPLRKPKSVEEERGEVVVQTLRENVPPRLPFRKEMRLEKFLQHGRRDLPSDVTRHGGHDDWHIGVALVIGGKYDRSVEIAQVFAPLDM